MSSPPDAFPGLTSALLDAAPLVVVVLSPRGTIEYINPFLAELTGRGLDEVRGRDWFDTFLPERDRESHRSMFLTIEPGGEVEDYVNPILTVGGQERFIRWHGRNLHEDGRILQHLALGQDVTDTVASEHARREAEERLRLASDASHDIQVLGRVDDDGNQRVVAVNGAYLEALHSLGIDARLEDLVGKTRPQLMARLGMRMNPQEEACFQLAQTSREVVTYEVAQPFGKDLVRGEATIMPLACGDAPPYFLWSLRNLSTGAGSEKETKHRASLLHKAEAIAGLGSWEWKANSSEVWLSEEAVRLFGLQPGGRVRRYEELLVTIHPSDRDRVDDVLRRSRRDRKTFEVTHRIVTPAGDTRRLRQRGGSVATVDGGVQTIGTALDVTERLRVERRLEREVFEKEVLLREMGHRVKNNLQLISSLLSLQERHSSSNDVAEQLRGVRGRVAAMALVHEKLEQSTGMATAIELLGYVRDLTRTLCSTYASCDSISVRVEGEAREVASDLAIPLGLLLTEMCSNSLKHAFRNRSCGRIRILLAHTDEGLAISAEDDGEGCEEVENHFRTSDTGMARTPDEGLGLRLIGQLVEQLDGDVAVTSSTHGTRYRIRIPPQRLAPPATARAADAGLDLMEGHVLLKHTPLPGATLRRRPGGAFVVESFNAAANALTKGQLPRFVGRSLDEFFLESEPEWVGALRTCLDEQRVVVGEYGHEFRLTTRKPLCLRLMCVPITATLVLVYAENLTPLRKVEQRESNVRRELQHRVRNNLATVRAMAKLGLERSLDLREFESRFLAELMLIARVHDALSTEDFQGLEIAAALRLAAAVDEQPGAPPIQTEGPPLRLTAGALAPFCLAARELRAACFVADGSCIPIPITWRRGSGAVTIEWRLPAVAMLGGDLCPLLEALVIHDLGGTLERQSLQDGGHLVTIELPSGALVLA